MAHRRWRARYRLQMRRVRQFVLLHILHADDPPRRLALGAAIGMFVAFTPTIGLQMVITVFLAWLLNANKAIGLPLVWLSNPATFVPLYYWSYRFGCLLLRWEVIDHAWWAALSTPPPGWWPRIIFFWSRLMEIATPLWFGCVVAGVIVALPTYYIVFFVVRSYRLRRWGQLTPPRPTTLPG